MSREEIHDGLTAPLEMGMRGLQRSLKELEELLGSLVGTAQECSQLLRQLVELTKEQD